MKRPIARSTHSSRLTARLIAVVSFAGLLYGPSPALAQLGAADDFVALAGAPIMGGTTTTVTCTGAFVVGDVGATHPPGVLPGCTPTGTVYSVGHPTVVQAYNDFVTAWGTMGALPCTGTPLPAVLPPNLTLPPGVYCSPAALTATNVTLTLDAATAGPNDTWVFNIGTSGVGALTGTGFTVRMINGGGRCPNNVFWRTADAATLTTSNFLGRILAGDDITTTGGFLRGQALANGAQNPTGAVTFTGTSSAVVCDPPPTTTTTSTTTTTVPPTTTTTTTTLRPRPPVCEDDLDHKYHHKWRRGEDQRHEHRGRGDDRDRKYCQEHHPKRKKGKR